MCRLVAYLSQNPILADEILKQPVNAFINQSRRARGGLSAINADGFGIGWYDLSIEEHPSLFKSPAPAWSDANLHSISSKIKTTCFVGHVRASTVGDVAVFNCHPFQSGNLLFAHNGTIKDFHLIKYRLLSELSPQIFCHIKGQTDSEYFFALINQYLEKNVNFLESASNAIFKAIETINDLKKEAGSSEYTRLNFILTNGKELIGVRYRYPFGVKTSLALHYSSDEAKSRAIITSEPLCDNTLAWKEIPENHILLVDERIRIKFLSISHK